MRIASPSVGVEFIHQIRNIDAGSALLAAADHLAETLDIRALIFNPARIKAPDVVPVFPRRAVNDDTLGVGRKLGELVGRVLRQFAPFIIPGVDIRCELIADDLQAGQLRLAHFAGLGDMVAHPTGELDALLLELVEQRLDALGLLGDIRGGHPAGVGVGVDQAQLTQRLAAAVSLDEAGHRLKGLVAVLDDLAHRRRAAVAADDDVLAAVLRVAADADGLLEPRKLDVLGKPLDAVEGVEVVRVVVQLVEPYVLDALTAVICARFGHILEHRC